MRRDCSISDRGKKRRRKETLKGNEARDRKERGPFQANRAKRKERSKKWSKFRLLEHRGSHQIEAQSRA